MEEILMSVATTVAQDFLDDNQQSILTIVQPDCFRDPYDEDSEVDELDMFIFSQLKRSAANKRKPQAEDNNLTVKKSTNSLPNVERIGDNGQQPPLGVKFVVYLKQCVGSTFSNHFKMTKSTFEALLQIMSSWLRNSVVNSQHVCLMSLWLLTSNESIASVADRFSISLPDCLQSLNTFCSAIVENRKQFIHWPTATESSDIVNSFNELTGEDGLVFPNIFGVLGSIELPQKKEVHSKLQCVCDSRGLFLDCFVATGALASKNNLSVFLASPLYRERLNVNGEHNVPGDAHMIADRSYPLSRFVMVPFKDRTGHLSDAQKQFNWNLSVRKRIVDGAFRRLCARFGRLQQLGQCVPVACALHNLCIKHGDTYELSDITDHEEAQDSGDTSHKRETCHDVMVDGQVDKKRNAILQRIEQQLTTNSD